MSNMHIRNIRAIVAKAIRTMNVLWKQNTAVIYMPVMSVIKCESLY